MYSGEWSLLILSNNGDCAPIDYERDFYLSVGPQQTTTVPPTIYVSATVTPIDNETVFSTQTLTSTASPSTTTVPRATLNPTITIRPLPTITKVTEAIFTLTKTRLSATVVATSTTTSTARCHGRRQRHTADPLASRRRSITRCLDQLINGETRRTVNPEPSDDHVSRSRLYRQLRLTVIYASRSAFCEAGAFTADC